MKNILILIVAIAIFLHFYPQPKLEKWFDEQKTTVLTKFSNATDTKVRLSAHKIYRDLEPSFSQFSPDEVKFVSQITQTRDAVEAFFFEYCKGTKQSPKLHRDNQKLVCEKIKPYQSLF